ncbi:hypothetical protein SAV14893_012590 [Streptomyces avermitilis]|uniref:Uncharacterized protein n=1 Tax=Streptomyces avermitilis TaxID=33903 RepID=A0A4D4LR81_STRAX|nr:hypothetical protein SAV14893_012590 [Streptomyces avermitilis]GDY78027.1 hypothetical protein SAV31267_075120 [Streptomyces avermitilis]
MGSSCIECIHKKRQLPLGTGELGLSHDRPRAFHDFSTTDKLRIQFPLPAVTQLSVHGGRLRPAASVPAARTARLRVSRVWYGKEAGTYRFPSTFTGSSTP